LLVDRIGATPKASGTKGHFVRSGGSFAAVPRVVQLMRCDALIANVGILRHNRRASHRDKLQPIRGICWVFSRRLMLSLAAVPALMYSKIGVPPCLSHSRHKACCIAPRGRGRPASNLPGSDSARSCILAVFCKKAVSPRSKFIAIPRLLARLMKHPYFYVGTTGGWREHREGAAGLY
jgi:hypothetical protein